MNRARRRSEQLAPLRKPLTTHASVQASRPPTRAGTLAALATLADAYAKHEDCATEQDLEFGRRALWLAKRLRSTRTTDEHNATLAALLSLADDHDHAMDRNKESKL